jgi:hypothetical protein
MLARFSGLWRHPDLLKLWADETVSQFGSLIGGTALAFAAILVLGGSRPESVTTRRERLT